MAKTNITQYSSTPSSNTDINNINIDENCPASGLNNAIRELMAHLKNVDTGSQALTALSVTGDTTISSGNLLVGGTTTNHQTGSSQEQLSYIAGGYFAVSRSDNDVAFFNRQSSDGSIINIRKDGTTVGSIGVDNSDNLFIEGNSTHAGLQFGTDVVIPHKNGAIVDDVVVLGQANNRFVDLYLSGGVYLGGTGSANYLSDYEEGTFTPSYSLSTTDFDSITFDIQTGKYTKIGNVVYCHIVLRTDAITVGSGSGTARVGGLPFTASGSSASGAVGRYSEWVTAPSSLLINSGTTAASLNLENSTSNLTSTAFQTGTNDNFLDITFHYYTNA